MGKSRKIITVIVLLVVFGAQVWRAKQQQKERKAQQEFIRQLSRQQTKERMNLYQNEVNKALEKSMRDVQQNLDSVQSNIQKAQQQYALDSIKSDSGKLIIPE